MPNRLVCNAGSCASNAGGICNASRIHIKGPGADREEETRCATYCEDSLSNNVKNIFNTNYTGIVSQEMFDGAPAHPSVSCSANTCKFNTVGDCTKQDLQIYAEHKGDTSCASFELK